MARKIKLNGHFSKSLAGVFDDFVVSQTAQGLSDITLTSYRHHLHSISNHLDIQKPMDTLTRKDLEAMVVSMRVAGLAHNSISSYCRVLRTFLNWCKHGGMNIPELPNIKDRMPVSGAVSLNTSQIEEIARLNTGVAVVHQSGWLNPVLCKIDLFPSESFCPLDYTPYEVPKDLLLKARGVFLELLLCKRMKRNVPPKQYCADAMEVLSLSRDKNDRKISQYIKDYLAAGKMTAWDSFDEMCRMVRTLFDADKLFHPFPDDAAEWNKKAYAYMKAYARTDDSTISDFLAVSIISRNSVTPQAKPFYFKWLANKE